MVSFNIIARHKEGKLSNMIIGNKVTENIIKTREKGISKITSKKGQWSMKWGSPSIYLQKRYSLLSMGGGFFGLL